MLRHYFSLHYLALALLFILPTATLAEVYDLPKNGSSIIGETLYITAKHEDTFVDLAQKYDVGYADLKLANPGIDPWVPGEGTPLIIPKRHILPNVEHKGLVINIAEMRLYYFPDADSKDAGKVYTFPLGIGREGWDTPLGKTKVTHKRANPTWTPPESIRKEHAEAGDPLPRVVPAGKDNPLGQHAIYLGFPSYLLHGTNKPAGIGMRVSHGCLRLFPKDIGLLFTLVKAGTQVNIIDEPYKLAWKNDVLYMEAHPPDAVGEVPIQSYTPWVEGIIAATKSKPDTLIDWDQAQLIVADSDGIPTPIQTYHP